MTKLQVCKCSSESLALANVVYVNNAAAASLPLSGHVSINDQYYYIVREDPAIPQGQLGVATVLRSYMQLSLGETVSVQPFEPIQVTPYCYIDDMTCGVQLLRKKSVEQVHFDAVKMAEIFRDMFNGQILSVGQPLVMESVGTNFRVTVHDVRTMNLESLGEEKKADVSVSDSKWGILSSLSGVQFVSEDMDSNVQIVNATTSLSATSIIRPDFRIMNLGIGGLSDEINFIFRRAFLSRLVPPELCAKLHVSHVRGVLLHGPPGTGKTLIARQLGKMLNAREPKIVNGPEVLNKYVGQSEENIRNLFKDAEEEYKAKGEFSQLHIIIFDELDAICRKRGSRGDSSGVGDQVVDQLLSKMDGVEQLNNILVIGMTNRLDLIDAALLRPGRMALQVEIGLPDENGRHEIFMIHTASFKENNMLSDDVDLRELAAKTMNYSGAEIAGVVNAAMTFAINDQCKVNSDCSMEGRLDAGSLALTQQNFLQAINEVKPAFGRNEGQLSEYCPHGIIHFSDNINRLISDIQLCIESVKSSTFSSYSACLLLHGPHGTGKTALAAHLAIESKFPFVKFISSDQLSMMNSFEIIQHVVQVFNDAYKSPLSFIVLDGIERLINYVPVGPRFNDSVLNCLMVQATRSPPFGHRSMIIATTNDLLALQQLGMHKSFTRLFFVPPVNGYTELSKVIEAVAPEDSQKELRDSLVLCEDILIPVKRAIDWVHESVQSGEKYVELLSEFIGHY